jgi:hypothetical protein
MNIAPRRSHLFLAFRGPSALKPLVYLIAIQVAFLSQAATLDLPKVYEATKGSVVTLRAVDQGGMS